MKKINKKGFAQQTIIFIIIAILVIGGALAYDAGFISSKATNLDGDTSCERQNIPVGLSGDVVVVDGSIFGIEPEISSVENIRFLKLSFLEPFDMKVEVFDAVTGRSLDTFTTSANLDSSLPDERVRFDTSWFTEACSFDKLDMDLEIVARTVETKDLDVDLSEKKISVTIRNGQVVS